MRIESIAHSLAIPIERRRIARAIIVVHESVILVVAMAIAVGQTDIRDIEVVVGQLDACGSLLAADVEV